MFALRFDQIRCRQDRGVIEGVDLVDANPAKDQRAADQVGQTELGLNLDAGGVAARAVAWRGVQAQAVRVGAGHGAKGDAQGQSIPAAGKQLQGMKSMRSGPTMRVSGLENA